MFPFNSDDESSVTYNIHTTKFIDECWLQEVTYMVKYPQNSDILSEKGRILAKYQFFRDAYKAKFTLSGCTKAGLFLHRWTTKECPLL